MLKELCESLLSEWCDALIELQLKDTGKKNWTGQFGARHAKEFMEDALKRCTLSSVSLIILHTRNKKTARCCKSSVYVGGAEYLPARWLFY